MPIQLNFLSAVNLSCRELFQLIFEDVNRVFFPPFLTLNNELQKFDQWTLSVLSQERQDLRRALLSGKLDWSLAHIFGSLCRADPGKEHKC